MEKKEEQVDMLVLTEAEQKQLAAWNATRQDYPREACLPHLVEQQAHTTPEAVALVADGQTLTYRDLNQRANQLAHALHALGVGPNVLVGVCLERSFDLVVGLLAVLKAGGAYVPLDPSLPAERLAFLVQDAQTPVLLTQHALLSHLPTTSAHLLCLDTDTALFAQQPRSDPACAVRLADLAYVLYTSGSTGWPKGVQISHNSLLNLLWWHRRAFAVTSADRGTQLTSPAFDATGWELWPYLSCGASVYLLDEEARVQPVACRDFLLAHRISISFLPTALAEQVLRLEWPQQTVLRYLLTGADTLQHYPSARLPFALINNYGPTEATVVATSGLVPPLATGAQAERPPTIGRPIANTQVYLLDEHLRPVPPGSPGELYIGGVGVATGYLRRPELTAERFLPHPWSAEPGARLYKTGDLARYLPDGQLEFLGRLDYQIKLKGYRHDLPRLDAVALELDLVVQPSQELELAIGQVACQVPGLVESGPWLRAPGMWQEALRCQLRAPQVAGGHAPASDVQFPWAARGHRPQVLIQQIDLGIGNGPANRGRPLGLRARGERRHQSGGGDHGSFGRAIVVDQRKGQPGGGIVLQGIRPGEQEADADPVGQQKVAAGHWLHAGLFIEQVDTGATAEIGPQLPAGGIKSGTGELSAPISAGDRKGAPVPPEQVEQAVVADLHPLGPAGGPRGVEHIRQVGEPHRAGGVGARLLGEERGIRIQAEQVRAGSGQVAEQCMLSEQHRGLGILHQEGQALGRQAGVKRDIGTAGLEDSQQADHQVKGAFEAHAHQHVWADAQGVQSVGELVGTLVEVAVGEGLTIGDEGNRLRGGVCLLLHQMWQARLPGIVLPCGVPCSQLLLLSLSQYQHIHLFFLLLHRLSIVHRHS